MIQTEKEYREALESLNVLTNQMNKDLDPTINDLVNQILKYENEHFPIEKPPTWAVVEFHIYDRLVTKIQSLPLTDEEKSFLAEALYDKSEIPPELVEKIKNINPKELVHENSFHQNSS